ncbi:MAG: glycosyltransferase WbuB [Planctomycetota bacterium]|nr:MAG: glycosyltransferase WbuB [Planctomycetota bacterium]
MHIVYVSQYFPPEVAAPAVRVYELSRQWVRMGHRVTVVTGFPHHPTGVVPKRYRGYLLKFENCEGIRVIRTWLYAAPNVGVFRRSLCYLSFMISAIITGLLYLRRPDVVIATSPQLLVGVAGWLIAKVKRCAFIFEVRDLWPEALVAVGLSKPGLLISVLKGLARFLHSRSSAVVTVTKRFQKKIQAQTSRSVYYLPNGVDTTLFYAWRKGRKTIRRVGYVGTMGMAHGLEVLVDAAANLNDVEFHFWGEGARKRNLIYYAQSRKLENVFFHAAVPRSRVPEIYNWLDICVISLRPTPIFADFLPSKLLEALACGVPVIAMLEGEGAEVAAKSGGAVVIPPGAAQELVKAINRLRNNPQTLNQMSSRGSEFIRKNFDRALLAKQYLSLVEKTYLRARP